MPRKPCIPTHTTERRGLALFEALVALVMVGALAALLARGAHVQVRAAADVAARTETRRVLRAAAAPLIAELRHAVPSGDAALQLHGDQLRIRTTVADGGACLSGDGRLALLGAPIDAPLAAWHAAPDARDALHLLLDDDPGDRCDRWTETAIVAAGLTSAPPPPCPLAAGGAVPLLAPDTPPAWATAGDTLLARVLRRVTWRLTSSAGGWYLGRARCDAAAGTAVPACDAPQPVTGPFLSPAAGGFRLRPLDALGAPLSPSEQGDARAVEILLVAPVAAPRPGAAPHESLHVVVPLPGGCS